jgi:hypothetical protein
VSVNAAAAADVFPLTVTAFSHGQLTVLSNVKLLIEKTAAVSAVRTFRVRIQQL